MTTLSRIHSIEQQIIFNPYPWKEGIGHDGKLYIVFLDEYAADYWESIFSRHFGLSRVCFGNYMNAYGPLEKENDHVVETPSFVCFSAVL
jgi:hypothetical protein